MEITYILSDELILGIWNEVLTISALKGNKVVKTISFYSNIETCFGIEKMDLNKGLSMSLNLSHDFEGKKMEISENLVKEILEMAKEKELGTIINKY